MLSRLASQLATGDELVAPGAAPGPAGSSPRTITRRRHCRRGGGETIDLGIAGDTIAALGRKIAAARDAKAPMFW